jgi:hypothetical protein
LWGSGGRGKKKLRAKEKAKKRLVIGAKSENFIQIGERLKINRYSRGLLCFSLAKVRVNIEKLFSVDFFFFVFFFVWEKNLLEHFVDVFNCRMECE